MSQVRTQPQPSSRSAAGSAPLVGELAAIAAILAGETSRDTLHEALRHLRQAVGARCLSWYAADDSGAQLLHTAASGTAISPPAELSWSDDAAERWHDVLQLGAVLHGALSEFPKEERSLARSLGGASIALVPLLANSELIGLVHLGFGRNQEPLAQPQLDFLRAASGLFSAALGRLREHENLRRSETQLRTIMHSSLEYAIVTLDSEFVVCQSSPAAERIFGPCKKDCPVGELIRHKRFGKSGLKSIARSVAKAGSYEAELELSREPNGNGSHEELPPRRVHLIVSAMLDELSGKPSGYLLFARDVTQLRERENRLLDSQRMESVGLLAAGIAHDYNNILMGILGYASLAQDLVGTEHPARRMLSTIEASAERAASLTSQLMAYCRGGKLASVPVDLDDLTSETLNIVGSNLPATVKVQRQPGHDMPNVLGDPTQLQQVVMNLVLNAGEAIIERDRTRHAGKSGGTVTISTRLVRLGHSGTTVFGGGNEPLSGSFVRLRVADDGSGMSPDTLRRIFEPFFTTKFTGRGLGLAAVQGIIHNHGGGMAVTSTEGKGSTFDVYLPATKRLADPLHVAEPLQLEGTETVLIIDDESVARQLGLLTLANLGYQVLLAGSGEEGIETYRQYQNTISLVILDLTMPGMAGEDVLAELAMMEHAAPVLLTSGYDEHSVGDVAGDASGKYLTGFLQKPYTPEVLAKAVREILDRDQR